MGYCCYEKMITFVVFDFKDSQIVEIFALADRQVTRKDIRSLLKPDEDSAFDKFL